MASIGSFNSFVARFRFYHFDCRRDQDSKRRGSFLAMVANRDPNFVATRLLVFPVVRSLASATGIRFTGWWSDDWTPGSFGDAAQIMSLKLMIFKVVTR